MSATDTINPSDKFLKINLLLFFVDFCLLEREKILCLLLKLTKVLQTSFYGHRLVNLLDYSMTVRCEYFRVARFA